MAECQLDISSGMLSPGVFNIKQFLNETEEMRWTVSSRYISGDNDSSKDIDLGNYDAFLVLQHGATGEPDEVMLSKIVNKETITLIWSVGKYATWLKGYVSYQIVFRGRVLSELSVLTALDERANGVYKINNEMASGKARYWVHESHEEYKIKYDTANFRWQLLDNDNELSYQNVPNDEPHYGLWNNLYMGNVSAMAWRSLQAVMYISESISADELVSAKCPTILRQMWFGIRDMIIKSGVIVLDGDISEDNWEGEESPFYINVNNIIDAIPNGCSVADVMLAKTIGNGAYSNIDNIKYELTEDNIVYVYCLEKVTGKVSVTLKGGNDYVFVQKNIFDNAGVLSINGKTGVVELTTSDIGAVSESDVAGLQEQIDNSVTSLQEQIDDLGNNVVTSVNGLNGDITLTASDLGAVTSVNNKTGNVTLTINELGGTTAEDIAELQEQIDDLNDNMVTENAITELQEQIDSLNDNMVTESTITNLQSQINDIKGDIGGAITKLEGI